MNLEDLRRRQQIHLNGSGEAMALVEKPTPTLGEQNPLIHRANLADPRVAEAICGWTRDTIAQNDCLAPIHLGVIGISTENPVNPIAHVLQARFGMDEITDKQICALERVAEDLYGQSTQTRRRPGYKGILKASRYPDPTDTRQAHLRKKSPRGTQLGWCFGRNVDDPVHRLDEGVLVYRETGNEGIASTLQGKDPEEWFMHPGYFADPVGRPFKRNPRYVVEVRDGGLSGVDMVELVLQTSHILKTGEPIDGHYLKYAIYNELNRLGVEQPELYGLEGALDVIERELILPLANLDLSRGISQEPQSILMVGIPGVGKTALVQRLLHADAGVFIVPIDALTLKGEIAAPANKQTVLPRISQIFQQTGIPVVLQVDDVETMAAEADINNTLLNLMAGVRSRGFFLLASTNHPELFSDQLIQPQRFGRIVYLGFPTLEARRNILEIHAQSASKRLGKPLFASDEDRVRILTQIAEATDNWTPRYLADVCNGAAGHFLSRIAKRKGRGWGLTEEAIDEPLLEEDWVRALDEVTRHYPKERITKEDSRLQEWCRRHVNKIGFATSPK